jgi:hypothetical protein
MVDKHCGMTRPTSESVVAEQGRWSGIVIPRQISTDGHIVVGEIDTIESGGATQKAPVRSDRRPSRTAS